MIEFLIHHENWRLELMEFLFTLKYGGKRPYGPYLPQYEGDLTAIFPMVHKLLSI